MKQSYGWMTAVALALGSAAVWSADPMQEHAGHGAMGHEMGAKASAATPMVDAEVRRIDVAGRKLTLNHGPLTHLNMGAMTMVFAVKDATWLQTLKVGDKVRVAVDRVDGTLTVVAIEAAK
jgi:Cu/Ag efflux protein CusF